MSHTTFRELVELYLLLMLPFAILFTLGILIAVVRWARLWAIGRRTRKFLASVQVGLDIDLKRDWTPEDEQRYREGAKWSWCRERLERLKSTKEGRRYLGISDDPDADAWIDPLRRPGDDEILGKGKLFDDEDTK